MNVKGWYVRKVIDCPTCVTVITPGMVVFHETTSELSFQPHVRVCAHVCTGMLFHIPVLFMTSEKQLSQSILMEPWTLLLHTQTNMSEPAFYH